MMFYYVRSNQSAANGRLVFCWQSFVWVRGAGDRFNTFQVIEKLAVNIWIISSKQTHWAKVLGCWPLNLINVRSFWVLTFLQYQIPIAFTFFYLSFAKIWPPTKKNQQQPTIGYTLRWCDKMCIQSICLHIGQQSLVNNFRRQNIFLFILCQSVVFLFVCLFRKYANNEKWFSNDTQTSVKRR